MNGNEIKKVLGVTEQDKCLKALLCEVTGEDLFDLNDAEILSRADEYLDTPIPFLPLSLFRAYKRKAEREPFEKKYREKRNMLLCLILAQGIAHSDRYVDKICDLVWAISEETTWVLPSNTGVSPTAPYTDVPEVYSRYMLHGVDLYALGTAAVFSLIFSLGINNAMYSVSDILPERTAFEVYNRSLVPFLNRGLDPTVKGETAYTALGFIAQSGTVPEDISSDVRTRLSEIKG